MEDGSTQRSLSTAYRIRHAADKDHALGHYHVCRHHCSLSLSLSLFFNLSPLLIKLHAGKYSAYMLWHAVKVTGGWKWPWHCKNVQTINMHRYRQASKWKKKTSISQYLSLSLSLKCICKHTHAHTHTHTHYTLLYIPVIILAATHSVTPHTSKLVVSIRFLKFVHRNVCVF